ncbi:MAG: signal peptidase I [Gammaproteobacteria bacterium]|nr:signal peptidase I [Gammaproteobacteria bacterium]MDH3561713.1 signal peptidase I [Gammaproteobacteria bacterium]
MNFDFPTLLVTATLFTGFAWAVDALAWAPRRRARAGELVRAGNASDSEQVAAVLKEPTWVEYCKSFFPVILAVLLLRSFLVEPFRIPSGSMMPTLLVGDFILVNKYAYGIRLPVLNTKVIEIGEPQRGDVVVFRYPKDPSVDYIKRVVGIPGDRIGYYDKVLYINGKSAGQVSAGVYVGKGSGISMSGASERSETLGEIEHNILVMSRTPGLEGEYMVREGEYFVMGDNRDNSNDSRYWGPVPETHLVGKAFRIWMNWDSANGGVGLDRIGMKIQ